MIIYLTISNYILKGSKKHLAWLIRKDRLVTPSSPYFVVVK